MVFIKRQTPGRAIPVREAVPPYDTEALQAAIMKHAEQFGSDGVRAGRVREHSSDARSAAAGVDCVGALAFTPDQGCAKRSGPLLRDAHLHVERSMPIRHPRRAEREGLEHMVS